MSEGLGAAGVAMPADGAGCGAQRRCIATGTVGDRAALLRFAIGPAGEIVPDVAARLPGRGLWLTPRRDIVERAVAKRLFARAARRPVVVSPGLADTVESLLVRRCCEMLGFARRAGLAVAGFEKVSAAARGGKAGLLLFALDGAQDGRRKIASAAGGARSVSVLTAAEQGAAFGRDRAVHVAVAAGTLCDRLLAEAERVAGFRGTATAPRAVMIAPAEPARQNGGTGSR